MKFDSSNPNERGRNLINQSRPSLDGERGTIMGVFKRKNKDGEERETWYVDYRDPTGKRIIKAVGPSKREAQDYLSKIKASIREGRFFDIKKENRVIFHIQ